MYSLGKTQFAKKTKKKWIHEMWSIGSKCEGCGRGVHDDVDCCWGGELK